jgi:hypothetical protein
MRNEIERASVSFKRRVLELVRRLSKLVSVSVSVSECESVTVIE